MSHYSRSPVKTVNKFITVCKMITLKGLFSYYILNNVIVFILKPQSCNRGAALFFFFFLGAGFLTYLGCLWSSVQCYSILCHVYSPPWAFVLPKHKFTSSVCATMKNVKHLTNDKSRCFIAVKSVICNMTK